MPNPLDRRFGPTAAVLWSTLLCALPVVCVSAQEDTGAEPEAQAAPAEVVPPIEVAPPADIQLPERLPADLTPPEPGSDAAARLSTPVDEALSRFEPTDFGDVAASDEVLPPAAEQAVSDAMELLDEGRHFEAVARLREAERLSPDHPRVIRALGLASIRGGNTVRGGAYLRRAAAMDPADTDARVVLARLALDRRAWEDAAALAAAIQHAAAQTTDADPAASHFAKYVHAVALDQLGYADAAASLYAQVLDAGDDAAPGTAAGREMFILRRQAEAIRERVGDLHLRRAAPDQALEQYQQIDPAQLIDPAGLVARLAYTHLALGQRDQAAQAVVAFLASPSATEQDAGLVAYLVAQGAEPAALDARLVAAGDLAPAGHFPLVAARAVVLPQSQTVGLIDAWLAEQPPRVDSFRRAIALLRGGSDAADDPEALSHALSLTAAAMERQPALEVEYAQALLGQTLDAVALIRALRRPEIADDPRHSQQLLSALAYVSVGRAADAYTMFGRVLDQTPDHTEAQYGMVRVLLTLGWQDPERYEEAQQLLGEVAAGAAEERFLLQVQLFRHTDQLREASDLVQSRLRLRGQTLDLLLLNAELTAETGGLQRAIPLLRQVIEAYPSDESAYTSASRIVLRAATNQDPRQADAFILHLRAELEKQLPNSKAARYEEALWLFRNEMRPDLAVEILEPLLAQYPDDPSLLGFLEVAYEAVGDQARADALLLSRITGYSPGARRAVELAIYYTGRDSERVTAIVRETMAQDEEGVLPGPPMAGWMAASLLNRLTLVVGEDAAEPDYLRAIRRFPDDPTLNNALGYRWAAAGKNLLAAEAMLLRAIEHSDEPSSAVLDSMGWVYYKMGRFAEAEQYLRQSIARHREEMRQPGSGDGGASKAIHYDHLGDTLYRQGETASAVRHWVIARGQTIDEEDAAVDPEAQTVTLRCAAKVLAVQEGREPEVSAVPGEQAFGPEGHPADRAP